MMKLPDRFLNFVSNLLRSAGGIALTLMMLITVADVVGRFLNIPFSDLWKLWGF